MTDASAHELSFVSFDPMTPGPVVHTVRDPRQVESSDSAVVGRLVACVAARHPGARLEEAALATVSTAAPPTWRAARAHTLVLVVRGALVVRYVDPLDRALVPDTLLEELHGGLAAVLERALEVAAGRVGESVLTPGAGQYLPTGTPHQVAARGGEAVVLTMTVHDDESRRRRRIHGTNALLRRFGLPVPHVGDSPMLDSLKSGLGVVVAPVVARLLGRGQPRGA